MCVYAWTSVGRDTVMRPVAQEGEIFPCILGNCPSKMMLGQVAVEVESTMAVRFSSATMASVCVRLTMRSKRRVVAKRKLSERRKVLFREVDTGGARFFSRPFSLYIKGATLRLGYSKGRSTTVPEKELVLTANEKRNLPYLDALALDPDGFLSFRPPLQDLEVFREHLKPPMYPQGPEHLRTSTHPRYPYVLDAGCGPALYAEELAGYFRYQGIDLSAKMVEAAQKRNPTLCFKQRSFRDTGFEDNLFDGIWASCVLNTTPKEQLQNVFSEWRRILKPNGLMMVVMPNHGCSDEEVVATEYNLPLLYAAWFPQELAKEVIRAGFSMVVTHDRKHDHAFSILARK